MGIVLDDRDQTINVSFETRPGHIEALELTLGPEEFTDLVAAVKWAKDNGLWDEAKGVVAGIALANYGRILRVKTWKTVVDVEGNEVPCTTENKLRFFGRYPLALRALSEKLDMEEAAEEKNSETSRDG